MPKLKYFGSHISDNIVKTDEGYIICKNVPIARTGWQTYAGRELGEETQKEHNIGDDDKVKVYRPPEEVFHPECIASFDTKPVTDGHPSEGRFVDDTNYKELLRGHAQYVKRGGEIDGEGNEALIADLLIQDKDLVREVLEDTKREVSCGYDYKLRLRSDGNFEQYDIRGNHVAVVPKGRAGDKVRINDADPAQQEKESPVAATKPTGMKWYDYLLGRGLKLHATDATPEETAEAIQGLLEEGHTMAEDKKSLSADEVLRAKDAEIEELKGKLKDAEMKSEEKEKAEDEEEHVKGCRCEDCKGMMDKKAKDTKAKDKKAKDKKAKDKPEDKEEEEPKGEDSDDEEEVEGEDEEMEGADAKLEPIPDLPAKERPKNPIPGADAALEALRVSRPYIAKYGDKKAIDGWNRAFDAIKPAKKATTRGGYGELANRATDGVKESALKGADNDEEMTPEKRNAAYQAQLDKANIRAPKGAN